VDADVGEPLSQRLVKDQHRRLSQGLRGITAHILQQKGENLKWLEEITGRV